MDGATNALELRLDAIEARLVEMERQAALRDALLLRAVEAVERFLSEHEDGRKLRADITSLEARVLQLETGLGTRGEVGR